MPSMAVPETANSLSGSLMSPTWMCLAICQNPVSTPHLLPPIKHFVRFQNPGSHFVRLALHPVAPMLVLFERHLLDQLVPALAAGYAPFARGSQHSKLPLVGVRHRPLDTAQDLAG